MPDDLIESARREIGTADPPIKAAALLHLARVETVIDQAEARRLLEEGLALLPALSERERDAIASEAVLLAAAVAPERAAALLRTAGPDWPGIASRFIGVLLRYGHIRDAVEYLSDPVEGREYPFAMAGAVTSRCAADTDRRQILRAAVRAWRQGSTRPDDFFRLFSEQWRSLPPDEATEIAREAVESILRGSDERIHASVLDLEFQSRRQFQLFEILGLLRALAPERADSLIREYPELARAAARFPLGLESVIAEANRQPRPRGAGGFMIGGSGDLAAARAMMEAEREGNTEPHFQEALRLYEEDTDPASPNRAPREFWPSTQAYRRALYASGKIRGRAAAADLERVPDRDLRLFAQIELAAALAGLPSWQGPSRIQRWGQAH